MEAIDAGLDKGGASRWERVVETWITRSLALPEGVSAQLAGARAEALQGGSRSDPGSVPEIDSAVTPVMPPVVIPAGTPEVIPEVVPKVTPKPRRIVPAKVSNDDLAAFILEHADDPAELNPYRVNKILRERCGGKAVGEARAALLVDLAQRRHREHRVIAIGERR
jgi:hypothetical protein